MQFLSPFLSAVGLVGTVIGIYSFVRSHPGPAGQRNKRLIGILTAIFLCTFIFAGVDTLQTPHGQTTTVPPEASIHSQESPAPPLTLSPSPTPEPQSSAATSTTTPSPTPSPTTELSGSEIQLPQGIPSSGILYQTRQDGSGWTNDWPAINGANGWSLQQANVDGHAATIVTQDGTDVNTLIMPQGITVPAEAHLEEDVVIWIHTLDNPCVDLGWLYTSENADRGYKAVICDSFTLTIRKTQCCGNFEQVGDAGHLRLTTDQPHLFRFIHSGISFCLQMDTSTPYCVQDPGTTDSLPIIPGIASDHTPEDVIYLQYRTF